MKVIFRADSSLDIGTGHVMRCLTLAQALREQEVISCFVCREHAGNLIDLIRRHGFEVKTLPIQDSSQQVANNNIPLLAHAAWLGVNWESDALQTKTALGDEIFDWMVVDHYGIDARWERQLKSAYRKLMVIDDIADRVHECDLLLDPNLGRTAQDYASLVPEDCQILVGPQYALLRPEFSELRPYSLARRVNPTFKRLLISMGGVDKDNVPGLVLASIKDYQWPVDLHITVVMGPHAPWLEQVRHQANELSMPIEVLTSVDNMAQLMADCDLAIGAAGGTSWERCCLGLPTVIIILAQNQYQGAMALSRLDCALVLEPFIGAGFELNLLNAIQETIKSHQLNRACSTVTDGEGCNRVVRLMKISNDDKYIARAANIEDERLLLEWANEPQTRANSFNTSLIDKEGHHSWFISRLASPDKCLIYVVENFGGKPLGQVRFEINRNGQWEIDYSLDSLLRGKGLGKVLLEAALNEFRIKHPDEVVTGKVKKTNVSSSKVFEALNFEHNDNFKADTIIYCNAPKLNAQSIIVIATPHRRNTKQLKILKQELPNYKIIVIDDCNSLSFDMLLSIKPEWIFFPHWSWIIPKEIHENFECVVFHMTDLPYGRGGSPLQNLIVRGHKQTMLSAIKCVEELDAGPIYGKRPLGLEGTGEEILLRASEVMKDMIIDIVRNKPTPIQQIGDVVEFKRRKPQDGNIEFLKGIDQIYDYIRMLDAKGYPPAFFQTKYFQFDLTEARWDGEHLEAKVCIRRKEE